MDSVFHWLALEPVRARLRLVRVKQIFAQQSRQDGDDGKDGKVEHEQDGDAQSDGDHVLERLQAFPESGQPAFVPSSQSHLANFAVSGRQIGVNAFCVTTRKP